MDLFLKPMLQKSQRLSQKIWIQRQHQSWRKGISVMLWVRRPLLPTRLQNNAENWLEFTILCSEIFVLLGFEELSLSVFHSGTIEEKTYSSKIYFLLSNDTDSNGKNSSEKVSRSGQLRTRVCSIVAQDKQSDAKSTNFSCFRKRNLHLNSNAKNTPQIWGVFYWLESVRLSFRYWSNSSSCFLGISFLRIWIFLMK